MIKRFKKIDIGEKYLGVNQISGQVVEILDDNSLKDYVEIVPPKTMASSLFLTLNSPRSVQKLLGSIAQILSPLVSIYGAVLGGLVMIYSWSIESVSLSVINQLTAIQGLSAETIFLSFVLLVITKTLHELGHAAALRRFGQKEGGFGIKLIVLAPLPFCHADEAYLIESRTQRLCVAAMGLIFEGVSIAFISILVVLSGNSSALQAIGFLQVLYVGTLIFNLTPVVRFDGSWALALYTGNYAIFDHATAIYNQGFKLALKAKKVGMYIFGTGCSLNSTIIISTIVAGAYYTNILLGILVNILMFNTLKKKTPAFIAIGLVYGILTLLSQEKLMVVTIPDDITIKTSIYDTIITENGYKPQVEDQFRITQGKKRVAKAKLDSNDSDFRSYNYELAGYDVELRNMLPSLKEQPKGNYHNETYDGAYIEKGSPISVNQSSANSFWAVIVNDKATDKQPVRFVFKDKVLNGTLDLTTTKKLPAIVQKKAEKFYAGFQLKSSYMAKVIIKKRHQRPDPYQMFHGRFL